MGWLGFGELNYTKFLCRLFFILERSTCPNKLVREELFSAAINKTGYIRESGYNLVFINKQPCNSATIGVISLNNSSSAYRSQFTKNKLEQYGCPSSHEELYTSAEDSVYDNSYDQEGFERLIQQFAN